MNKFKQKTKTAFVLSLFLSMFLVVAYSYVFYIVQLKNKEVAAITDELNDYLNRDGAINILKNNIKDTAEERVKLQSYFVSRDDLPLFAEKIESIGDISGVRLDIKKFIRVGNIFTFDISSEGSFIDTMHLVALIDSLPFKVEFKKVYVNIKDSGPESNNAVWEGNFSIELVGFIDK